MNFSQVFSQLNNLPNTYKRPGATFQSIQSSFAFGLDRYANGSDGLLAQTVFTDAESDWLDLWADIWGIPRNNNEGDPTLINRIELNFTNWKLSPVGMTYFMENALDLSVEISEDYPYGPSGFQVSVLNPSVDPNTIARDMNVIRPAGVPFTPFKILAGGLFLNTIDFLGNHRVTGNYLTNPLTPFFFDIPSYTNNTEDSLPLGFLENVQLNPSLA